MIRNDDFAYLGGPAVTVTRRPGTGLPTISVDPNAIKTSMIDPGWFKTAAEKYPQLREMLPGIPQAPASKGLFANPWIIAGAIGVLLYILKKRA